MYMCFAAKPEPQGSWDPGCVATHTYIYMYTCRCVLEKAMSGSSIYEYLANRVIDHVITK